MRYADSEYLRRFRLLRLRSKTTDKSRLEPIHVPRSCSSVPVVLERRCRALFPEQLLSGLTALFEMRAVTGPNESEKSQKTDDAGVWARNRD